MPAPLAELSQVYVERNGVRLLDIPSLILPVGQDTVIFGPNGSGKSTLLKLLMRFYYPSASDSGAETGRLLLLGREEWNVWELRKHLGLVSSEIDHHFTTGRSGRLTPFQAVLTGFESGELELEADAITPEREESVRRWLDFFEMDADSTKHVGWMSTGERRRVMLARAMVLEPDALLLDEPTAGLDLVARSRLLQRLAVMADQGVQLLLVTHHLEEVLPSMERVILLKKGKIFADTTPDQAFRSDRLSDLFDAPIIVESHPGGWFLRCKC